MLAQIDGRIVLRDLYRLEHFTRRKRIVPYADGALEIDLFETAAAVKRFRADTRRVFEIDALERAAIVKRFRADAHAAAYRNRSDFAVAAKRVCGYSRNAVSFYLFGNIDRFKIALIPDNVNVAAVGIISVRKTVSHSVLQKTVGIARKQTRLHRYSHKRNEQRQHRNDNQQHGHFQRARFYFDALRARFDYRRDGRGRIYTITRFFEIVRRKRISVELRFGHCYLAIDAIGCYRYFMLDGKRFFGIPANIFQPDFIGGNLTPRFVELFYIKSYARYFFAAQIGELDEQIPLAVLLDYYILSGFYKALGLRIRANTFCDNFRLAHSSFTFLPAPP